MRWGLACVLAAALIAGVSPVVGAQAVSGEYQPASQTLMLDLPAGVFPTLTERSNPPRLLIELPGVTQVAGSSKYYTSGLVQRFEVQVGPSGTTIVLVLRQALHGQYRLSFVGSQMRVSLIPMVGYVPPGGQGKPRPLPPTVVYPPQAPLEYGVPPAYQPVYTPPPRYDTPPPRVGSVPATPVPETPAPTPTTNVPASTAPSLEPSPLPTPTPTPTPVPTVFITPEPLASLTPPPEIPADAVFNSRLAVGGYLPLTYTETYPAGHMDGSVGDVPGGTVVWDYLFTPNFGMDLRTRAMSYVLLDDESQARGTTIRHQRDDYDGRFGIFGRLPFPFGFELMAGPGLELRYLHAAGSTGTPGADYRDLPDTSYLSAGYLGLGASLQGGLGWRLFGPLALVLDGELGYMPGGKVDFAGSPSIFPLLTYRAEGALRLNIGSFMLDLGYELGHGSHTGPAAGEDLEQDWSGPTGRLGWQF